ncbi:SDR family NAD(P)-dependent oxidoreductase [Chloroflexota bacterium]
MELGLKDKVVLISGAGEGIGRQAILTFAHEGAKVIVNDIVGQRAESVAAEARSCGAKALVMIADVSNANEVDNMIENALSEFGKIDVLVNNAFAWDRKAFSKSTREEWSAPINICLYGTLNCSHAVINHMIERRCGKIISVVSDAARVGQASSPIYAAAKAAIIAFSKSLASEAGRYNVNVNCVSAAATNTERRIREHQTEWEQATPEEQDRIKQRKAAQLKLYPICRLGEPADVADMIVFLASERADYITGQLFSVNGGYCMVD